MIKGLWGITKIICGCDHEEQIELYPKEGPIGVFYACPKYYPENRTEDERACFNRINLNDYEAMLKYLSDMVTKSDEKGEVFNPTNLKWSKNGIDYEVIEYNDDKLVIKVFNRKSLS